MTESEFPVSIVDKILVKNGWNKIEWEPKAKNISTHLWFILINDPCDFYFMTANKTSIFFDTKQ